MADEVSLLEVKLELAEYQAAALAGTGSGGLARLVAARIAASVALPALIDDLVEAQTAVDRCGEYCAAVAAHHREHRITDAESERLVEHYEHELAEAKQRLSRVDARVELWRHGELELLDQCASWVDDELAFLRGRAQTLSYLTCQQLERSPNRRYGAGSCRHRTSFL